MCRLSPKNERFLLIVIAILTLLSSLSVLAQAALSFSDPFLQYAKVNLTLGIYCIICFAALIVGGALGCVGTCCKCRAFHVVLFFCLLFSTLWLFGLSAFMVTVH